MRSTDSHGEGERQSGRSLPATTTTSTAKAKPPPGIITAGGVDMARAHASGIRARPSVRVGIVEMARVILNVETDPRKVPTERRPARRQPGTTVTSSTLRRSFLPLSSLALVVVLGLAVLDTFRGLPPRTIRGAPRRVVLSPAASIATSTTLAPRPAEPPPTDVHEAPGPAAAASAVDGTAIPSPSVPTTKPGRKLRPPRPADAATSVLGPSATTKPLFDPLFELPSEKAR